MNLWKRLSKAEKKSEALKKINEADLLTIDDFGLRALIAQEQSLAYEIIKSHADNLSTIIVSQRPCADWYGWLGGKYITDGASDRRIPSSIRTETGQEAARVRKVRRSLELRRRSGRPNLKNQNLFRGNGNVVPRPYPATHNRNTFLETLFNASISL